MIYQFQTKQGKLVEVKASIHQGPPERVFDEDGEEAFRVWTAAPDVWHTDGAHKHMYNKTGDKLEQLNKSWSSFYHEKPPPKSKEVKRNSTEIQ